MSEICSRCGKYFVEGETFYQLVKVSLERGWVKATGDSMDYIDYLCPDCAGIDDGY